MRANQKRKSRTSLWNDLTRTLPFAAGLVIGGLFLGYISFNEEGVPLYLRMHHKVEQLKKQTLDLETTNQFLREEIQRIQFDPLKLEELARNQLGMVRKGETVYQFVEPQPPNAVASR